MDNITQLTDKELFEKETELNNLGKELTRKENPTDEDIEKSLDCRRQIENIKEEINKRDRRAKELNECKQYVDKDENAQNIEHRGARFAAYGGRIIDDTPDKESQEMRDFLTEISKTSNRYMPKRCPMLMPQQNISGICSRGERANNENHKSLKSIVQMAAMISRLKGADAPIESRAESFGLLSDNKAVVPTMVSSEIVAQAMDIAEIIKMCDVIHYTGDYKILKKDLSADKIQTKKTAEREEIESHMYKYTPMYLKGNTIRSEVEITNTMINSAPFDVVADVVSDMADTFSYDFERSLFHPDEYGMEDDATFGFNGVDKIVPAQGSEELTLVDLLNLEKAVPRRYTKNAVYLMNRDTLFALLGLRDSAGHMHYIPDPNTGKERYFFRGHPILEVDSIVPLEAEKIPVYFGDMKGMTVKIGRKLVIKTQELLKTDSRGIYGVLEFDARVKESFKFAKLKMQAK